jgi:hypothetical protein
MRKSLIIAALGLGACTTTPAMESALAPLAGQPVQLVFEQLGPPASSTQVGADTVYVWNSAKMVRGVSTQANLIPPAPSSDGVPANGTFSGAPVPYTCDLRIVADADGRIEDWQFGEQTGGCRDSARKLRQLALADPR